jgi:lipopolysaccharide transport system ATP-binding protein
MSDVPSDVRNVIELEGVSKVFDVYRHPRARMMAALGLPGARSSREQFVAVQDITFSIKPGERVGLIGRNGAGKSTILKMVAGLLRPTEGRLAVNGRVQALLELGTGFHPEFTGRANVFASLAYQGIAGPQAQTLFEDVLDFTELDEFIDRPVKTYSAGMYARLAFATATAVRPEVLIVDEILGAGDAYFGLKSSQRMLRLTGQGTTMLFVSHDIASVLMMCDRAIWIDRGRMLMDDLPHEVGKRYAASIRRQSELRLKAENLKLLRSQIESLEGDTSSTVICRFVPPEGAAVAKPVTIRSIAARDGAVEIDRVLVGSARDNEAGQPVYLMASPEFMNWGPPRRDGAGGTFREIGDFGGVYGHAPFAVQAVSAQRLSDITIEIEHGVVGGGVELLVQQHNENGYRTIGKLATGPAGVASFALVDPDQVTADIEQEVLFDVDARYGRDIGAITSVSFSDGNGDHRFVYEVGEQMNVEIDWRLGDEVEVDEGVWVVCVYGLDGRCISQVLSPPSFPLPSQGSVTVRFDPLRIGRGDYLVSVGLFNGLSDEEPGADDPVCVLDRAFKIRIEPPPAMRVERGLVLQTVEWRQEVGDRG